VARKSYYELLKHPKWQEKRLRVMERAGFACEWCEASEAALHVHHTRYRRGAKPWEYEDDELLCLCVDCHARATEMLDELSLLIGQLGRYALGQNLMRLMGYARAMVAAEASEVDEPDGPFEIGNDLQGYTEAEGIADFHGIRQDDVWSSRGEQGELDHETLQALDPRLSRNRKPTQ
jgi:hypothetical protein